MGLPKPAMWWIRHGKLSSNLMRTEQTCLSLIGIIYLGDIKTTSKYIRILCRDHEYEDGDRIKLMLNKAISSPKHHTRETQRT